MQTFMKAMFHFFLCHPVYWQLQAYLQSQWTLVLQHTFANKHYNIHFWNKKIEYSLYRTYTFMSIFTNKKQLSEPAHMEDKKYAAASCSSMQNAHFPTYMFLGKPHIYSCALTEVRHVRLGNLYSTHTLRRGSQARVPNDLRYSKPSEPVKIHSFIGYFI